MSVYKASFSGSTLPTQKKTHIWCACDAQHLIYNDAAKGCRCSVGHVIDNLTIHAPKQLIHHIPKQPWLQSETIGPIELWIETIFSNTYSGSSQKLPKWNRDNKISKSFDWLEKEAVGSEECKSSTCVDQWHAWTRKKLVETKHIS